MKNKPKPSIEFDEIKFFESPSNVAKEAIKAYDESQDKHPENGGIQSPFEVRNEEARIVILCYGLIDGLNHVNNCLRLCQPCDRALWQNAKDSIESAIKAAGENSTIIYPI